MLNEYGFDEWAKSYESSVSRSQTGYPFEGYADALDCIRTQLQDVEGKDILDIGVGTGALSGELYQRGARIWGLDFSSRMLRQAKSRMPEGIFLLHNITDGVPAEIQDRRFDAIVSSYAVHHIQRHRLSAFLCEYLALLKTGGLLLIADIGFETQREHDRVKQQFASIWDDSESYLIGEKILSQLHTLGVSGQYTQISFCAGVLSVRTSQSGRQSTIF